MLCHDSYRAAEPLLAGTCLVDNDTSTLKGHAMEVKSVHFSCLDSASVRRLSVVDITSAEVLDNLGRPVPNGLYDERMGPIDRQGR